MDREDQTKDASDREADLYERKLHRDLALKLSGTGTACVGLAFYGRDSVVWLLILTGLGIFFYAKAWEHRRQARAVDERLRPEE